MKNIIACFLILTCITSQAQEEGLGVIPKGSKFIGGNLSINFNESATTYPDVGDNKSKTTSFDLGPVVGKYIRDNVSIGLGLGYGFDLNKNEYYDGSDTKSSYNSVGVYSFIRKNYKIVPNIFFFIQAQTSLFYGTSKYTDITDNETKSINYGAGLGGSPGFQLFLGKKFSLETNLGSISYRFTQSKVDDSDVYTNNHALHLSGGLDAVNFSIRYYIFP